MRKILFTFLFVVVGFVIWVPLSKYKLDDTLKPLSIPENLEDLDTFIFNSESQFSNLTEGSEKKILWFSKEKKQTEYSLLFFHGFSTSRKELDPLIPNLAQALQANVYFPRLTGHGLTPEEFAKATANDWLNDTVESFLIAKKIGKKVIVIGSSTGCLFGVWLASREEYKKDLDSLILISANFHPAAAMSDITLYLAGIALIKLVYGNYRTWQPPNELVKKYWIYSYPWEAIVPMMTLVDYAKTFPYSQIETPALFLYTEHDTVIDTKKIQEIYEIYKSNKKKIINLKEVKNHVMAGDAYSPESTELVKKVILSYLQEIH